MKLYNFLKNKRKHYKKLMYEIMNMEDELTELKYQETKKRAEFLNLCKRIDYLIIERDKLLEEIALKKADYNLTDKEKELIKYSRECEANLRGYGRIDELTRS